MSAQHTPPRLRLPTESAEEYRVAMGWDKPPAPPTLGLVERLRNGGQPDLADMASGLFETLETLVDALTTGAGRNFIEAFTRDAMAALEAASPGWSKADEPTRADVRREALTREAAPELLAALRTARSFIHTDCVALADCHTGPDGLDEDGAEAVAEYDDALAQIDAAIAAATGATA